MKMETKPMKAEDVFHTRTRAKHSCRLLIIKKKMQDEIRRVKNLKGKLPPWYIDRRPKNAFWDDDPVSRLPGVGKKTAASLIAIDICKIGDLKLLSEVDLCDFAAMSNDPNLTTMKLKYFIEKAHESLEGSGQDLIQDYRKEDNPYEARFGDDWLIELKKVQLMQPYVRAHVHGHELE